MNFPWLLIGWFENFWKILFCTILISKPYRNCFKFHFSRYFKPFITKRLCNLHTWIFFCKIRHVSSYVFFKTLWKPNTIFLLFELGTSRSVSNSELHVRSRTSPARWPGSRQQWRTHAASVASLLCCNYALIVLPCSAPRSNFAASVLTRFLLSHPVPFCNVNNNLFYCD